LVIFGNFSFIGSAKQAEAKQSAISQQTGRCGGLIEMLGLPLQVFIATEKGPDAFRKPAPGMWEFMAKNCNGGVAPDLSACFFVGGAAGRAETPHKRPDHDDYDKKFAENVGIKFFADDEFFHIEEKQPGPKMLYRQK